MNKTIKNLFIGFFLVVITNGCGLRKDHNPGDMTRIYLEDAISEGNRDMLERDKWNIRVFELEETDSTLLSDFRIAALTESDIYGYDSNRFYSFSKDGRCRGVISRKGEGPGEYLSILDAAVSDRGDIYIVDLAKGAIHGYRPDGIWFDTFIHPFGSVMQTADGLVALSSPQGTGKDLYYYHLDADLNISDSIRVAKSGDISKGYITVPALQSVDSKTCVMLGDTVFGIDNKNGISPVIVFENGRLSMPEEIACDFSRKEERVAYIGGLYSVVWGDLAFVCYQYKLKMYFDIWNMTEDKLVFRNIVDSPDDYYGFPLKTDEGVEYRVWPSFSENGKLSGIIDPRFQSGETVDGMSNPMVFEIN